MSFIFLLLAGVSVLILADDIQTNATTSQIPLFLYLIWSLAGTLFLFAILRAVRLMRW